MSWVLCQDSFDGIGVLDIAFSLDFFPVSFLLVNLVARPYLVHLSLIPFLSLILDTSFIHDCPDVRYFQA